MCACANPSADEPAASDYVQNIEGGSVGIEMVWVPEAHLWVSKHEVTWDAFLLYCDFEESSAIAPGADAISKPSKPLDWTPYDRDWGVGQRPAVGMSWNSAKLYCEWLSQNTSIRYRLPSESEWRVCAGEQPAELASAAWFEENSGDMTQEVGQKAPNEFGLHDMYGNLWEYCSGPYSADDTEQAVLRGGSWKDSAELVTREQRLAFNLDWTLRDPNYPPGVWWIPDGDHLGFRIVRDGPAKGSK